MTKYTVIAGHGRNPNGSWDPGARGYDGGTEAGYIRDHIIPAMKKYVPKGEDFEFVTDENVYSHGTLNRYKGSIVTEVHLDAFTPTARGGHVIIHKDFAPDHIDLAIRDVINKYIGVRYNHMGHTGISGRADLKNANIARQNGINYRLIECAFISNPHDMQLLDDNLDAFARDLVKAICGSATASEPVHQVSGAKVYTVQPGDTLWGIADAHKTTVDKLKKDNYLKSDLILPGQRLRFSVDTPLPSQPKAQPTKSINQLAKEVIDGKHGNGDARKKALGSQYDAVQKRVDELLAPKKSIDQLAREVIDGKHGNGDARKKSLGSLYDAVQKRVNELI